MRIRYADQERLQLRPELVQHLSWRILSARGHLGELGAALLLSVSLIRFLQVRLVGSIRAQ